MSSKDNAIQAAVHFFKNALDYHIFCEMDEIKARYTLDKLLEAQEEEYCIWELNSVRAILNYKTSCGNRDVFFKKKIYCSFCGKKIQIKEMI